MNYPKVQIIRAQKREGLIRARLLGAAAAKAPVLTYLDSHCECTEGWLEPLLDRIARDPTTVVCPVIDVIDDTTLEYHWRDSGGVNVGGFDWNLQVRNIPTITLKYKRNSGISFFPKFKIFIFIPKKIISQTVVLHERTKGGSFIFTIVKVAGKSFLISWPFEGHFKIPRFHPRIVKRSFFISASVQLARGSRKREKEAQESRGACMVTDDGRGPLLDRSCFLRTPWHVRQWLRYLGRRKSRAFFQNLDVRRYVRNPRKNIYIKKKKIEKQFNFWFHDFELTDFKERPRVLRARYKSRRTSIPGDSNLKKWKK